MATISAGEDADRDPRAHRDRAGPRPGGTDRDPRAHRDRSRPRPGGTDRDPRPRRERPRPRPGGAGPPSEPLGRPAEVPSGSLRDRIRSRPGLREAYRVGVFVVGLVCVAAGVALAVLPGPLTIPPVLLGLWIWSTEFAFARRFFETTKRKGQAAWGHARRHPVSSAAVTVGGLLAAAAVLWAIGHFQLVDRVREAVA